MRNPFETEEFRKLRKEWNQKLEESGFNDCEDTKNPFEPLKKWHNFMLSSISPEEFQARQDYLVKARDLLESYSFENQIQKRIWELHCEGFSKRKIETLISHLEKPYKREQIGNIIKLIQAEII